MHTKHIGSIITAALLCLLAPFCMAQEARELTSSCVITSPNKKTDSVHDGEYTSFWRSRTGESPYLEFQTPEGEAAQYLYICFAEMPEMWSVETETDGEWRTLLNGSRDYMHVLLELDGQTHFRIVGDSGKESYLKINEVFVFGDGDLPDWVQRWEPTPEKADLLLLVAHPDDELIFFGGTIPTYAVERGMNVVVAYMSYSNTTRRSELLNGLWHLGVRQYPVIGSFADVYMKTLDEAYSRWRKKDSRAYVAELIRQYKPDVMLTHDINGEYGHGAHKLCASVAQYCVERTGDEAFMPESAEKWGDMVRQKALSASRKGEHRHDGLARSALIHGRQNRPRTSAGSICLPYHAAQNIVRSHRRRANEQRQIQSGLFLGRGRLHRRRFL